MIISDSKRFIFLHNPKSAGTSIRHMLRSQYDTRSDFFWGLSSGSSLKRPVDKAHMALDDMRILFPGDYKLLEEYFVFMFVRDPLERYISSFVEFLNQNCKQIKLANCSGDQLVELMVDFTRHEINENKIRYDVRFRHFIPQYLIGYSAGKSKVDYIGYLSRIDKDMQNIFALLKLNEMGYMAEKNLKAKKFGKLIHDLPQSLLDKHARLYEQDYLYFNFDKLADVENLQAQSPA